MRQIPAFSLTTTFSGVMSKFHVFEVCVYAVLRVALMLKASLLQYSKSSRATCHGPAPCKGSPIELGTLRYGQVSAGKYGETVEWRHW